MRSFVLSPRQRTPFGVFRFHPYAKLGTWCQAPWPLSQDAPYRSTILNEENNEGYGVPLEARILNEEEDTERGTPVVIQYELS